MNQKLTHRRTEAVLAILALAWCGMNGNIRAQTNTAKAPPGNRYLLIVETSRIMDRRMPGVLQTVQELLGTTLGKELAKGDTVGIWTFNEKLNPGRFPLQAWTPGTKNTTIAGITNFLAKEKCQKQAHVDQVIPVLASVIERSPVLTVALISSGNQDISGTPFDDQINSTFKKWRDQQQTKRMPFVVIFRAMKGKMTGCAVAPVPWPLEPPPLPELPKPIVAQPKSTPVQRPAPTLPPLIVTGKKPRLEATNAVSQATTAGGDSAQATAPAVTAPVENQGTNLQAGAGTGALEKGLVQSNTVPQSASTLKAEASTVASSPAALVPVAGAAQSVSAAPSGVTTSQKKTNPAPSSPEQASRVSTLPATTNPAAPSAEPVRAETTPQVAVAAPQPQSKLPWMLVLGVAGCLVIGAVILWLSANRSRTTRQVSFITRSIEHSEQG